MSNPLFGRALAGAQADRQSTNTPTASAASTQAAPASGSAGDGEKDFMEQGSEGLVSNEFQVQVKLADLQADPNSPLYSAKSFEELPL